jgi:hypothetical protein
VLPIPMKKEEAEEPAQVEAIAQEERSAVGEAPAEETSDGETEDHPDA